MKMWMIDKKGMEVNQPTWLLGCPGKDHFCATNAILVVFSNHGMTFFRTAWQPYRLSHLHALCINLPNFHGLNLLFYQKKNPSSPFKSVANYGVADTHEYWSQFRARPRDIHIECSKQFKGNLYFYVSGQSGPFWAVLKLLYNSNMKFK